MRDYTGTVTRELHEHRANGTPPKSEEAESGKPTVNIEIETELYNIFFVDTDNYARAKYQNEVLSYNPVDGSPTLDELGGHLNGYCTIGGYTLHKDSTVLWICLDTDSTDLKKARNITTAMVERLKDVPHALEYSGNKGYHIWIFLKHPVSAARAKAFGSRLRDSVGAPKSGDPHVEVFPKQEKLTESSPMGNLVKLPLGIHPRTKKRSVFCQVGSWESEPIADPLPLLRQRVDFDQIENVLDDAPPAKKLATLLAPYWVQNERHNLCLCLSGLLCTTGWVLEDTIELVRELVDQAGGEERNLLECVTDTYKKAANGGKVQGLSGLTERLPVAVLREVMSLTGGNVADPVLQVLDRIRLEKSPTFLKVRSVAGSLFPDLADKGRFIQPLIGSGQYWFEQESHKLWDCESKEWTDFLFRRYGLIKSEGFYAQVYEAIEHMWRDGSAKLPIYDRTHWDGQYVWLNLGDEQVYRLDGETITRTYNGEGDLIFRTDPEGPCMLVPDLLAVTPLNPWDYLTSPLNFAPKDGVTGADPDEQRNLLQAYLLSMAFTSIAKTKPIAGILGPSGSGKTSASRNIGRVWNKPYDDVLSISHDKPDSFRTSITNTVLVVMDNLETTTSNWLADMMSKIATGAQIEIRTLYKTNDKYTIRPYCYQIFSAIDLPDCLKQDQLASRILPLQLDKLRKPKAEAFVQQLFYDNYAGIWAGLAKYINQCIPLLRATDKESAAQEEIRLADFANFCRRVQNLPASVVDYKLVQSGLRNLSRQQEELAPTSPFLLALDLWLGTPLKPEDPTTPRTLAELFPILKKIASDSRLDWKWKEPAGLGRHVKLLQDKLKADYGCTIGSRKDAKGNVITTYAFPN